MEPTPIGKKEPVMPPRLLRHLALGLGCLSFFSILVAHLALTDIYHGETDLSLEWRALQVAFGVIVTFHVAAFVSLMKLSHRETLSTSR